MILVTRQRAAVTLIESLVVLGILGILISLLAVAVIRVREAGARLESTSNLKQIVLATHHFAASHRGMLPPLGDADSYQIQIAPGVMGSQPSMSRPALFVRIRPFVEQTTSGKKGARLPVRLYVSPADPTAGTAISEGLAVSSYAANAVVFRGEPRMTTTFADGTSNTIAFAEHYAKCESRIFYYGNSGTSSWRPAFADDGDEVPVTEGNPPVSKPKFWPRTFQVRPSIKECQGMVPQTPHPGGMLTAMADGSVRQISGAISIPTFWGAVTPASGEVLAWD